MKTWELTFHCRSQVSDNNKKTDIIFRRTDAIRYSSHVLVNSDHFAAFLPANATIEMMQEPEISLEAGMQPDEMVDELGRILGKYEVPMGLMNKRK